MGCTRSTHEVRVSPETVNVENHVNEVEYIAVRRTCTDIIFLILMIAFTIVQIGLLTYSMYHGDIYRIINGYDDCGNLCGRKNLHYNDLGCTGADHTKSKYLLVNPSLDISNPGHVHRVCVESCENQGFYESYLNRCFPIKFESGDSNLSFFSKTGINNFFQEVSEDLGNCWQEILYLCIFAFVISLVLVIALRFVVGFIIWLILIGIVLALISGTIFLWMEYANSIDSQDEAILNERKDWYLTFAVLITIATICICLIIFALRRRIGLVIELFKEAGKAITCMPIILFEPILTFLTLSLFASLWIYFAISIESAGVITTENSQSVQYIKDSTMLVSRWYNLLALFWFANFVIGCQHMVIAGAVAMWFFTRKKTELSSPIVWSFRNLVFYHLGTVSKGSFFLALVNLIKTMLKWLTDTLKGPKNWLTNYCIKICQCCLFVFERFLQYLNRNAYIETGQPFCTSAKRSFSLIANNALRVFAINSVGDFVLLLTKAFIVLCTVLIGIEVIQKKEKIHHSWVPLVISGIFAYFVAHCFISVYEMIIDTIFICFCEDCEQNDGIDKPYFMSRGLMEYVKKSKQLLSTNGKRTAEVW